MIIAVRNDMQNMGKSMVSCLIANAIALLNPDSVVWLVDTDPQATLVNWSKTSPNLPKGFQVMTVKEFDAAEGSPDFTVFDTEKSLTKTNKKLAEMIATEADQIIIPTVLTKGFKEYGAMVDTVDEITKTYADSKYCVLFNRVKASDQDLLDERKQYAKIHKCHPLTAYISDNEIIASTFDAGTLPQYVNNTAITAEFEAVWKEIIS